MDLKKLHIDLQLGSLVADLLRAVDPSKLTRLAFSLTPPALDSPTSASPGDSLS